MVHRESLWDENARAEALGALIVEQQQICPRCGNLDSVQEVPNPGNAEAVFTWPGRDGSEPKKYQLVRMRCVACAALATAERDAARHPPPDPAEGHYGRDDGAWTVAIPYRS
ncbi:hypothetical protein GCM10009737_08340 [Nocardioides lentus]|uniref:Uncharacterized protein n=1 Tax=Nocardioides lentus TaxID=338077 RepID=A0ABP5ACI0_9ACTN